MLAGLPADWRGSSRLGALMTAAPESQPSGPNLAAKSRISVLDGFRRMPVLYLSLLAAYLLLAAAAFYADRHSNEVIRLLGGDPSSEFLQGVYPVLCGLVEWLLDSLVLTIAAVAMHRFILLGEVGGPALTPSSLYMRRFFGALLVVEMLAFVPLLAAAGLALAVYSFGIVFLLIGFCAAVFIIIRSSMVFPAMAIGDFRDGLIEQIEVSWRQMDGRVWTFISGVICVAWPFILLIVFLALFDAVGFLTGIAHWPHFTNTLPFKLLNDGFIQLIVLVLDVGLASWLYAWVRPKNDGAIS